MLKPLIAIVRVMPAALTACGTAIAARPVNTDSVVVLTLFHVPTCVSVVAPVENAAVEVQLIAKLFNAGTVASFEPEAGVAHVIGWRRYEPVEVGSAFD